MDVLEKIKSHSASVGLLLAFFLLVSGNMSFKSIPVLDLSLADDPATKPAFLAELRHALMEVGFLYIKNVGISEDFFKKVISEGRAFFDIPVEEK